MAGKQPITSNKKIRLQDKIFTSKGPSRVMKVLLTPTKLVQHKRCTRRPRAETLNFHPLSIKTLKEWSKTPISAQWASRSIDHQLCYWMRLHLGRLEWTLRCSNKCKCSWMLCFKRSSNGRIRIQRNEFREFYIPTMWRWAFHEIYLLISYNHVILPAYFCLL